VGEPPSGLAPFGPAADGLVTLWWIMFWLAIAVFVAVTVLLVLSLVRQRDLPVEQDAFTGEGSVGGSNLLILVGGVVVPAAVILLLMVLMITTGASVRALGNPSSSLVVEVTGHKFWWDVTYPEAGVRTANEIRIPVGEPVEFRVTSADVIHSFWVPGLGGKIDMTPGEENYLRLQADEPGVHRGICTEYCGIQHALMHFIVVAEPADELEQWLAARQEPPAEPAEAVEQQGLEVFETAQCVLCHTVDGVSPHTELGPDLTDFGGRLTLGAGARPNEPDDLAEWILDPHDIKPGNHMPPSRLTDEELDALIAYLESLE
jgi:cytochrome c oxidase subunit II